MKKVALYLRVSTDRQTVENQREALTKIATARGWEIVTEYNDAGISGSKGRDQRPGLDQMLKDAQRRKFDLVATWAIDRLGRSLIDLLDTFQHLEACGVNLYIDQQNLDTTTPSGKLLYQVSGAFSEFEKSMIVSRVNAGLRRAVAAGVILGRPPIDEASKDKARKALKAGATMVEAGRLSGLSAASVHKIAHQKGRL
jgi:DNA invertase Pin-like site-specific DNA recombinase